MASSERCHTDSTIIVFSLKYYHLSLTCWPEASSISLLDELGALKKANMIRQEPYRIMLDQVFELSASLSWSSSLWKRLTSTIKSGASAAGSDLHYMSQFCMDALY